MMAGEHFTAKCDVTPQIRVGPSLDVRDRDCDED